MKKIIFTLAFMTFSGAAMVATAQEASKPAAGDIAVELNFAPFSGAPFTLEGLNARYFISDKLAARVNLDLSINSGKNVTPSSTGDFTDKASVVDFGLAPGIEYHFGNWNRVSLYGGAQLGISMRSASFNSVRPDVTYKITGATSDTGENRKYFGFGIEAFTGIDVYVYRNIYVGAEFGLGFNTLKFGTYKEELKASGSTTTTEHKSTSSTSSLSFSATPTFRLGWRF
ncbi:MAG: outer membrane beta-barrel protein [Rikenellaceae bacterium]|jgi:hypothetical protein|nr:outer membrane beta-barrel protein [Rikenellaceae bacterium]